MTLDQLASIGEIVGAIGVVISFVYLAIQIRTNTEAERTSTYAIFLGTEKLDRKIASYHEISNLK